MGEEGRSVSIGQWSAAVGEFRGPSAAEAALVRAGQAGDAEALDDLLALHERALRALCHGILRHVEDAEDAAQETFFRVLRALPRFRGDSSFRTWLLRIGVNVCLNWKRDHPATEPWDDEQPELARGDASPELLALRRLQVWEALRQLPPRHRAILLLKELEGWSLVEIGAAMGWNRKRVQNELYRARRTLDDWRAREEEGA